MNTDAAWFYANPRPAAEEIKGRVALWKGVKVAPPDHAVYGLSLPALDNHVDKF